MRQRGLMHTLPRRSLPGSLLVLALLLLPGHSRAAGARAPDQLHLSWVGDPSTSVAVTWRTGANDVGPYVVEWGDAPGRYDGGRAAAVGEPAPGGRGVIQKAQITDLRPDARYYYRVAGDAGVWGAEQSFKTAPAMTPAEGVTFTITADVGTSYIFADVEPILRRIDAESAGLHIIAGDLTYADNAGGTEYEERWMADDLPIVGERRSIMVAWGNHEYYRAYDVGYETITRYFQLPLNGQPNACNPFPYYSFRYGGVHVAILDDPESPCFDRARQRDWLRGDLGRAAAAPSVRWTVVVVHQPPFSSGCHGSQVLNRLEELDQFGVDLVVSGHDHNYERTWPVGWDGGRIEPHDAASTLPTYIVVGVGGSATYDCVASNPWTAVFDPGRLVGYLRVHATPETLVGEFVAKEAYEQGAAFAVRDRFEIAR